MTSFLAHAEFEFWIELTLICHVGSRYVNGDLGNRQLRSLIRDAVIGGQTSIRPYGPMSNLSDFC